MFSNYGIKNLDKVLFYSRNTDECAVIEIEDCFKKQRTWSDYTSYHMELPKCQKWVMFQKDKKVTTRGLFPPQLTANDTTATQSEIPACIGWQD